MIRRAAFLLTATLSALLAMTASPPPEYEPEASPTPEPTVKARIDWPMVYWRLRDNRCLHAATLRNRECVLVP